VGRKKYSLPFDKRGGRIVTQLIMLNSKTYLALPPQAKVLMTLLHIHYRNEKAVDYGVREAAEKIPCSEKLASKAFKLLQENGFIECVEQSTFRSRTGSKSRSWRLTWMPYHSRKPTNEWEKLGAKN